MLLNFIKVDFQTKVLVDKYKKLISSIKEYSNKLNDDKMKLLSSINAISDYVINPTRGIDYYIYPRGYRNKKSRNVKDVK